jgi:hypothetical protein
MLPDEVLLAIFDFCADEDQPTKKEIEAWQSLVHVCRRWRRVVFGSRRRLNLQLVCTTKTPARDTLDVWPALPLLIRGHVSKASGADDIIAVLERSNRVCQIDLWVSRPWLENVLATMQHPFPELTDLLLDSDAESVTALPNSFLGGSAPHLQCLRLTGIPFPGVPELLLSTTHLVHLHLINIPHSGYVSPEAIITALSTLTSLESLWLGFQSPQSCPDPASRRPPPLTRSVLPVLTTFWFKGVSEYLDDFVARIDAPQLNNLHITLFNQISFDTPHFIQFISRTPRLNALEKAHVTFEDGVARVDLSSQISGDGDLSIEISCRELDWQLSSLEQVCTLSLPPLSALEDLYIHEAPDWRPDWQDNIENILWLELLHPFTAVKNIYLSEEFAPPIVSALQELVGGSTTEVLPTLQNIFLERLQPSGPVQEGIRKFVASRQVTSHPIAVFFWDRRS